MFYVRATKIKQVPYNKKTKPKEAKPPPAGRPAATAKAVRMCAPEWYQYLQDMQ